MTSGKTLKPVKKGAPTKPIALPPEHFDSLEAAASIHWWYQCRLEWVRENIQDILKKFPQAQVFDVGAGVGSISENLKRTLGIDVTSVENDPYACAIIRSKGLKLIEHDITGLSPSDLNPGTNVFLFLDVLEHLQHPRDILDSLSLNLDTQFCLITVPALPFLYSQWDVNLGHFHRYDKKSFVEMLGKASWEIVSMNYFFSFAVLPAFVFRRILSRLNPQKRVIIPPSTRLGNFFWTLAFRIERFFQRIGMGPPFGTSLMVILRKSETR